MTTSTARSQPIRPPAVETWRAAERVACDWMRSHGWPDAATTRDGADGGLDVTADGAVAQVKHWQNKVGINDVQRLYACAWSEQKTPLFFALSGYTAAAAEWADRNGVARFQMDPIAPCNAPERAIAAHRASADRWWRYTGLR